MERSAKKKQKNLVDFTKHVSPYDAPINNSGNTIGLTIWRKVRGEPRRPNDPEVEAQALRVRFVDKVIQQIGQDVAVLQGRNPMILAEVDQAMDDTLQLTNSKGEISNWREANTQEIFDHIRNVRPKRNRKRGVENQHDAGNVENVGADDQEKNTQDGQDEPNGADDVRANEVHNGDCASISSISLGIVLDVLNDIPTLHQTTLSEETKHKLNNRNMAFTQADMRDVIGECQNVHDFLAVFNSSHYQGCLRRIRMARDPYNDRITFAESWAKALSKGDPVAEERDNDRRMCLLLLYAMCDRWGGPGNETLDSTVTEEDIIREFRRERIVNILSECLVMDRASAWFNIEESSLQGRRGVHWYSTYDGDWHRDNGHGREHQHTMNKRLVWLFCIRGLHLREYQLVSELMKPARTPLADL